MRKSEYKPKGMSIDAGAVYNELSDETRRRIDGITMNLMVSVTEVKGEPSGLGVESARELLFALVRKGYLP